MKTEKYKTTLPKDKQIDALTWAAGRADMSYGKFVQTLSEKDRIAVFNEYSDYLEMKRQTAVQTVSKKR